MEVARPIENVQLTKIFIPASCNGSISITPDIQPIDEYIKDENAKSETVEVSYCDSSTDGIVIESQELYELDIYWNSPGGNNLNYLKYIPAFFSNGSVNLDVVLKSTDEPDNNVDLLYDVLMYIKGDDKPEWYPYDVDLRPAGPDDPWYVDEPNKMAMPYVMDGMVNSPNKEARYDAIGDNTNLPIAFTINSWTGFRPIKTDFPPFRSGIRMGILPALSFKIYIKNKKEYEVVLSSLTVSIKFNYDTKATLMNIGSPTVSDFCQLYCGPKKLFGDDGTGDAVTGPNRELWVIVDGYDGGSETELEEIVRVYGYFDKWNDEKKYHERQTLALESVPETGGTNFPPIVYKSSEAVIPRFDNDRMIYRGFRSGEVGWVVTQKEICQGSKFKNITVKCVKQKVIEGDDDTEAVTKYVACPTNDPDAEFHIWITLRDDVDEMNCDNCITITEFEECIQTVKFFDEDLTFASAQGIDGVFTPPSPLFVLRSSINKLFYDTLYDTYEDSVVLVTQRDDVEPYVRIKINSNQLEESLDWIPLYHGKPLKFNESLSKCTDGVRSREVWFYGDKNDEEAIANVIELDPDIPYQYRVSFHINATHYEDMHVHVDVEEDEEDENS